jgi:DNA modification methylase
MIIQGDSKEKLRELDAESHHSCVTDPPYFLGEDVTIDTKKLLKNIEEVDKGGFMGRKWDNAKIEVVESDEVPEELL